MARPPYSTRFLAVQGLSTSASYTVPDGFTAVVRCITVFHGVQPDAIRTEFLAPVPVTIAVYSDVGVSAGGAQLDLRVVLNPGEVLEALSIGGNTDVTVSGYLLSAS